MRKIYLVICFVVLLVGCEKNEEQLLESPQNGMEEQAIEEGTKIKYVKMEEIPEVLQILESHLGKAGKSSSSIVFKKPGLDLNAIVDLNTILEVVSAGKKTNYTFPLDLEGEPENEFYNLIIHKTATGEIKDPYIKRYVVFPDALENFLAHNRDFRYFRGTFTNYWVPEFFNALDNNSGKVGFKAFSTCDEGGVIGGGGTYNPDLIDVNNSVAWNGLDQTGYGRALGTWNDYGGTGGYDLDVRVRNNSTGYTEVSTVSSITSGSVVVSTGESSFPVTVYESTTWMEISTETTGSSGGSTGGGCSAITITRGIDSGYTIDVGNCLQAQKSSQPSTKAASGCPEDDGEVGVVNTTNVLYILKTLRISLLPNETSWIEEDASSDQIDELKEYLESNKTAEGNAFGLEAIRAWMATGEVDIVEQVILDKSFIDNDCLYGVYTAMGKAQTFNGYLQNFDTEMSVANLKFGYDVNFEVNYPIQTSAIAITNSPENYLIKIDFNGDPNLSSSIHGKPKLIVATSFMHEIIHAEIYRKMLAVAQQPDLNFTQWYIQDPYSFENFEADLKFNFFGVWDFYTRYEWDVPPGQEPSSPQHQQMAANYRNTIILAISEYDNNQHLPSIYEALSWYGLMGTGDYDPITGLYEKSTGAWEHIDEDPNLTAAQERINIHNTIINFQNNDTNTCN